MTTTPDITTMGRHHAEAILALPTYLREEVWPFFKRCSASDEMFFPTCLALLGEIAPAATAPSPWEGTEGTDAWRGVAKRRLTYCRWGDSPKSPEAFAALDAGVLEAAVGAGCLFARKFRPAAAEQLSQWLAHMRRVEEDRGGLGAAGRVAAYAEEGGSAALMAGDGKEEELAPSGSDGRNGAGPCKRPRPAGDES